MARKYREQSSAYRRRKLMSQSVYVCRDNVEATKAEPQYCLNIPNSRLGIVSHYHQFGSGGGDDGGVNNINGGLNVSPRTIRSSYRREAISSTGTNSSSSSEAQGPHSRHNVFCAPFDFFSGVNSNDIRMGMLSHTHTIDEPQVCAGFYPQQQQLKQMMAMQESEMLRSQSVIRESTASITIPPSGSGLGSSSTELPSSISVAETTPFIDFLGVGAT